MDPLLQRFLKHNAADLGLGSEATVDTLSVSDKDVLIEALLKYSDDVEKTKFRSAFTLVLVDGDALNVSRVFSTALTFLISPQGFAGDGDESRLTDAPTVPRRPRARRHPRRTGSR